MKKTILLSLAVVLFSSISFGQFALTKATHMPDTTDYFILKYFKSGTVGGTFLDTFDPDTVGGASSTWDFSSIPATGTFQTMLFANAEKRAPHNTIYFPTSTIVYKDDIDLMYYYFDSNFNSLGAADEQAQFNYVYTPGRKRIVFPSSYSDATVYDTCSIDINGSVQYDYYFTYKIDAWGSLTLPYDTFSNVVRVKRTSLSNGFGGAGVEDEYEYFWYAQDIKCPILYYKNNNTDGNSTIKLSYYFVPATEISLSVSSVNFLGIDSTYTLNTTFTPSNASNQNIVWTSSDTSIATVSNGVVTGVALGLTTITATSEDGGFIATCDITVTVGIEEKTINNNIDIFPNPNKGVFTITNNANINKIEIYDILGKVVFQKSNNIVNKERIDLSQYTDGIYLIKVYSGNNTITKKVLLDK